MLQVIQNGFGVDSSNILNKSICLWCQLFVRIIMSDYINTYPNILKLKHDNSTVPSFLHALKLVHVK